MKIAIHHREESYSEKWIAYCQKNNVDYKVVNCYDSDIVAQLHDCSGLMWHWTYSDSKAAHFARQLTYSLELTGKKVFPDSKTCWHYDDKVGQKYLFEAMDLPAIPTHLFYDRQDALAWCVKADFPIVLKLRSAGSPFASKVVNRKKEAKKLIRIAFGIGFPLSDGKPALKGEPLKSSNGLFRSVLSLFVTPKMPTSSQKGNVCFQDFISQNHLHSRVLVIGGRAILLNDEENVPDKRVSENPVPSETEKLCIKQAFVASAKLRAQCLAFDFIIHRNKPLLAGISYSCRIDKNNRGYWDKDMNWHSESFVIEDHMIKEFIQSIKENFFKLINI